jgi:hypothetical protein
LRLKLCLLFVILGVQTLLMADTNVPMQLNVSAVLRYSDGTEINSVTTENILIGLYTSETDYVWRRSVPVFFVNGSIDANLLGPGSDSNGGSDIVLNESLFEYENLQVGFTIIEDGEERLALVSLTSQPFAIKSAVSDYAHAAGDTEKIRGNSVANVAPEMNQVLSFVDGQWLPTSISNTMVNIDDYLIPTRDLNEISGRIGEMKVEKLLGKKLTAAVKNGSQIPTGSILMFSPDVDAPNGAFHPSSGNPEPGEVLTWDDLNDVWMPSGNLLQKLGDVTPPNEATAVKNVMIYDKTLTKYKLTEIGMNYLKDADTSAASSGQFLKYDGSQWKGAGISIQDLSNVNNNMSVVANKFLMSDGTQWTSSYINLKSLNDVDSGLAEGKILIGKAGGARFEYTTFTMDALTNVNTSTKAIGDTLIWTGTEWKNTKNKIESINELSGFNVSASPSNKFMYHNGTEWVDKTFTFVNKMTDLSDVTLSNQASGQVVRYNGSDWVNAKINMNDIKNVNTDLTDASPLNPTKKFLVYKNGQWQNAIVNMTDLSNVNASGAAAGDRLSYNGFEWVNAPLTLSGISNVNAGARIGGGALAEGDVLAYDGSDWGVMANTLANLSDIDSAQHGANKLLITNAAGTGFKYLNYTMEALLNTNISASASGRYLYFDGSHWIDKELDIVTSMSQLSDVTLATLSDNQLIKYDAGTNKWVNGGLKVDELSNVEFDWAGQSQTNPLSKFMVFTNGKWRNSTVDIEDMSNVNISGATTGQVLRYNGSAWVNGASMSAVSALTDVSLSGLAEGDALKYNATTQKWENKPLSTSVIIKEISSSATDKELDIKGHLVPFIESGQTVPQYNLGSSTNAWRHVYISTGNIHFGSDGNRSSLRYDTVKKEIVVEHENATGISASAVNFRLKNGLAVVGDEFTQTIANVHPLVFWDGSIKNKITQNESALVFNASTKALGLGIASPEAQLHVQLSGKTKANGLRLSDSADVDTFFGMYQGSVAVGDARTPYVFHSDKNENASKYHDMAFQFGSTNGLYMAIQMQGETGSGGYSSVEDVYVGIGTRSPQAKLDVSGTARATSMFIGAQNATPTTNSAIKLHVDGDAAVDGAIYISGGSDLAEGFHIMADETVEPGTVVSIDPNNIGKLVVSDEAYDTKVAGVVSGGNGIKAGLIMTQTGTLADGEYPIALTGRVWVKCSDENGDITVGDLLTTAATPGHAMKATGDKRQGAILGKAMSTCTDKGMVLTLISLQ